VATGHRGAQQGIKARSPHCHQWMSVVAKRGSEPHA
jgi:hypothetical protein